MIKENRIMVYFIVLAFILLVSFVTFTIFDNSAKSIKKFNDLNVADSGEITGCSSSYIENGTRKCRTCSKGYYLTGTTCTKCSGRTTTVSSGATSSNDCNVCTDATYVLSDGECVKKNNATVVDETTNDCPAGTFKNIFGGCSPCGVGKYRSMYDTHCMECPTGYTSTSSTNASVSDCGGKTAEELNQSGSSPGITVTTEPVPSGNSNSGNNNGNNNGNNTAPTQTPTSNTIYSGATVGGRATTPTNTVPVVTPSSSSNNNTGRSSKTSFPTTTSRITTPSVTSIPGIATPTNTAEPTKQCYVNIENGKENTYCYGDTTTCNGFTNVAANKDESNCDEDRLCYKLNDKDYVVGKYEGQDGYVYVGKDCPACYTDKDGTLKWGNYENTEGYTKNNSIVDEINCKTEVKETKTTSSKNMILYIILGAAVLVLIYLLLSSGKNKRQNDYEM